MTIEIAGKIILNIPISLKTRHQTTWGPLIGTMFKWNLASLTKLLPKSWCRVNKTTCCFRWWAQWKVGSTSRNDFLSCRRRPSLTLTLIWMWRRLGKINFWFSKCAHIRCTSKQSCKVCRSSSASNIKGMSKLSKLLYLTQLICHVKRALDLPLYLKAVRGYTSKNLRVVLPASLKKCHKDTIFRPLICKWSECHRGPADQETWWLQIPSTENRSLSLIVYASPPLTLKAGLALTQEASGREELFMRRPLISQGGLTMNLRALAHKCVDSQECRILAQKCTPWSRKT